jgi:hypothetical protein
VDLYYSHIIELLVQNIGIKRTDLYQISGIQNKREFLKEIDSLLANHRIIKEYSPESIRYRYSPKILKLCEHEKSSNSKLREHTINFIPTKELEKILDYINRGTEQEDCLEFELQIMGYRVEEKYKAIVEAHIGLFLNFEKFNYYLWAKFLDPFIT